MPLDVEYLATLSEDARVVLPDVHDRFIAQWLAQTWSDQAAEHRGHGMASPARDRRPLTPSRAPPSARRSAADSATNWSVSLLAF